MVTGIFFRSKQRRIMYVKKGRSTHNVNLEDYTIGEGWLMYTPVNSCGNAEKGTGRKTDKTEVPPDTHQ
jgi:hypothetical protein